PTHRAPPHAVSGHPAEPRQRVRRDRNPPHLVLRCGDPAVLSRDKVVCSGNHARLDTLMATGIVFKNGSSCPARSWWRARLNPRGALDRSEGLSVTFLADR